MPQGLRAGHPVHWRHEGSGGRQAILVHCGLAHSGAWKGVMERLAGRLDMVAFDLPGHGRSGDWDGSGHIQDLTVAIARDFLDDAPGRVDLIGHSFGATCLLRLAVGQPDRVRSLTLIEPPFYDAARGDPGLDRQLELDASFHAAIASGDREAAACAFNRAWGTGERWADIAPELQSYIVGRVAIFAGSGNPANADVADILAPGRLERMTAPVLLLRGALSPPVVASVERTLARRLPDARTVVIEGAGHMAPVTHPDEVARAIATHLDRT